MGMMQEITNDYVYLNCGPLFHIATFMTTMATFHFGGTNVFTPRVDAEELCRLIEDEGCTGAFIMGPTIGEILELNQDAKYQLKTLRTFGGKPEWNDMITVDTSPWARKPAGFGQTEVMGMLTLNAWGGDAAGNSGRPTPMVQVRIVDPDGNEVPLGETGEIMARGPTVMNGYHNRPELNAQRLAGGWHHTNDLGQRELDGSVTFVGPEGTPDQVRGREHLPGRGRRLPATAPGRARGGRHRHPRQEVGPERQGDHRAEGRSAGDRRRAHRALPGQHRVVQEAPYRRVRRRDAPPRLADRLRRPRRALRRWRLSGWGSLTASRASNTDVTTRGSEGRGSCNRISL